MAWPPPAGTARPALAAAAGVVLAVLASIRLGMDYPWWAALGAWLTAGPHRAALRAGAPQVMLGTLCGAVAGVLLAAAADGVLALQWLAIFAVTAVGTARRFAGGRFVLAWTMATLTADLVLIEDALTASPGIVAFAFFRVVEVLCGMLAVALAMLLLAPVGEAAAAAPAPPPAAGAPAVPLGRAALIGGCLPPAVALVWSDLGLPSTLVTALLAFFAFERDLATLRTNAGQRLLGCAAGGGFALAVLPLGLDGILPWAAALGGGAFLFATLRFAGPGTLFVGLQAGVILIFGLVTGPGPPSDIVAAASIVAGISAAVAIVELLGLMLRPPR